MQHLLRRAVNRLCLYGSLVGVDFPALFRSVVRIPRLIRERRSFSNLSRKAQDPLPFGTSIMCLHDRDVSGGSIETHYFHQDLHVARKVCDARPRRHVDIGSRVDGFVAHVAAFREIEVFDIRSMPSDVPNVRFHRADLMKPVAQDLHAITDSLSCLHALEHFGLGRYGDPLDPDGHLKGLENLHAMLKPGGTLYLSVPIGESRVEFNAHRVFAISHVVRLLQPRFRIVGFSYVDDEGRFHADAPFLDGSAGSSHGCRFGCGIFEAVKL